MTVGSTGESVVTQSVSVGCKGGPLEHSSVPVDLRSVSGF